MTKLFPGAVAFWAFVLFHFVAFGETFHQSIDEEIARGFAKWNVVSAERCSDAEFIRRIYLDFEGKIPDARTTSRFILSTDPHKRTKVIDRLLASDAFAQRMAVIFDVMLMERRPDKYVTTTEWRDYLASSFAENKPLDGLAREILAGGSAENDKLRPAGKYYLDRAVDKDVLVRDTGRLFLGMDLQCAQCHNHPTIDDWKHQHYFGLSAFFGGSQTFKRKDGKFVLQEHFMPTIEFASVFQPDVTNTTGPQIPFGQPLEVPTFEKGEEYIDKEWKKKRERAVLKFSLRELLAEELTREAKEAFSRNLANRLWGLMMGRGLVHPYDMDHSDNPPSHPELLNRLSRELRAIKYDAKAFLRELALSETYQRSSEAPIGVDPDKVPPESFALANAKGLSPEQLFDSLLVATGSEAILRGQLEEALREDAESFAELEADDEKRAKAMTGERSRRVEEFVSAFAGTAGRPEGEFQASLPQALFLANHEALIEWLEPAHSNLAEWLLGRDEPRAVAEEAYLAALSRMPTEEEVAMVEQHFASRGSERPLAISELLWSLLASAEFRLNH